MHFVIRLWFSLFQWDFGHRCLDMASHARHSNDCGHENHFDWLWHRSRENQKATGLPRILGLCVVPGQCSDGSVGIVQWISTDLPASKMGKFHAELNPLHSFKLTFSSFFSFTDTAMDFPRTLQRSICHIFSISIQLPNQRFHSRFEFHVSTHTFFCTSNGL